MDRAKIARELVMVAKLVGSRRVPLNIAKINQFRRDFLMFMKNTKRADTYEKAVAWRQAASRWATSLEEYIYDQMLDELKEQVYRKQVDEQWWKHWDEEIRKGTYQFMLSIIPPIEDSDSYWSKEDRFVQFHDKLPKWDSRVRRQARGAWKVLTEFVEWYEQKGEQFVVNEPMDEKANIEGFDIVMQGQDDLSDFILSRLPEWMGIMKEGLKRYRVRASKVLPLMLRTRIPIVVDFRSLLGNMGEYQRRSIMVNITGIESPNEFVRIMAHEMSHHLFKEYLTGEKRDVWYRFISGNYGELNLLDMAKKMGGKDLYDNKSLMKTDPVLYLQVMGLYNDLATKRRMGDIFTGDALREAIESGEMPETMNVQVKPISGYAQKSPEEAFCEAVGNCVAYGPATVFEEVRETLKQILPIKV